VDSTLKVYIDGQLAGEASGAALPAGALTVGGGYSGELDEVQLSGTLRDAAWIAVQAAQGPTGALVALGADEFSEGGGHGGIWGTLFGALTVDGWAAIGILAVMLVIALWIMFVKTLYVNRVDQANRLFMNRFRTLSTDLGAIDKAHGMADEFRHASLYRLYHVAATELSHRFKDTDAAHISNKNLSPQSLEAIRASLDTGLVRETTRLNRLMVLLTIAISGGPFIGLLGTVLGVMITFAVIAATGDVNVAAIAPGIAAALLATAAGMAVAIPALFGYNYLNSRIKTMTSDMRVSWVCSPYTSAELKKTIRRTGLSRSASQTCSAIPRFCRKAAAESPSCFLTPASTTMLSTPSSADASPRTHSGADRSTASRDTPFRSTAGLHVRTASHRARPMNPE